jgi:acyl carrier protein
MGEVGIIMGLGEVEIIMEIEDEFKFQLPR